MGRMKDIAIDMMDLQHAAVTADDEEAFMRQVMDMGWVSPTEKSARAFQASKLIATLSDGERIAVKRVLDAVGVSVPTVDLSANTSVAA